MGGFGGTVYEKLCLNFKDSLLRPWWGGGCVCGGGEVSDGYGGVWGRGRALACRRVTAGVMAVEPERR